MSSEFQPQQTASGDGAPENQEETRREACKPPFHVIRIPDKKERVRAVEALLEVNEAYVRTAGNLYGLSTKQVKALQANGITFEWAAEPPRHA
jgi:hypothetical protein